MNWEIESTNCAPSGIFDQALDAGVPYGCQFGSIANWGHEVEVSLALAQRRLYGLLSRRPTGEIDICPIDSEHDDDEPIGPCGSVIEALDLFRDRLRELVDNKR